MTASLRAAGRQPRQQAEASQSIATPAIVTERIRLRSLDQLSPNPRNARTHSAKQLAQIRASIETFGFVTPIVVDGSGMILAGHGRFAAARALKLASVPTICLDHLTDEQRRAYALADNRIAESAGWDAEVLSLELRELDALSLDFDLEVTGFDGFELDGLIDPPAPVAKADPADAVPEAVGPAVTRAGDVWLLGEHRLLCGDARDPEAYARVLAGERARMVFTDPPYNLPIVGMAGGRGVVERREFAMASGEMSPGEYLAFLEAVLGSAAGACVDGAILYACIDWRSVGTLLNAGAATKLTLKNICVWSKSNAGLGPFYRSQHELVAVFKVGSAQHTNTFGLGGRSGRYRTNVWAYAGVNTLRAGRDEELALHPTVKPVALVADAIRDVSRRGEIVLDPFAGSGTTVIAAQKTKRLARLIELDPLYCDTIVRRFQAFTGQDVTLEATSQSFAEVTSERVVVMGEEQADDA